MNKELKDALTCPVCLDLCKEALNLPECGHTLCAACIVLIAQEHAAKTNSGPIKIPCPECREESSLACNFLTKPNFKRNYFVDRAVEAYAKELSAKQEIWRVGEFCPHRQSDDSSSEVCPHCKKQFCKFCILAHVDLMKAEIGWAALDFDLEIELTSKPFLEQKVKLKSDLKENADKARQAIVSSFKELIADVSKLFESKCDSLLATIDKRQQELDEHIDNCELPAEIVPQNLAQCHYDFLEKFKVLDGESLSFCNIGQISDVFLAAKTIDRSLQGAKMFYSKLQSSIAVEFHRDSGKMIELLRNALDKDIQLQLEAEPSSTNEEWKLEDTDLLSKTQHFHALARDGNLSQMKLLLENPNLKASHRRFIIDHRDSSDSQRTAVMQATLLGHLEIVRYLIEQHKADGNIPDSNGDSPVKLSWQSGKMELLDALTSSSNKTESLMAMAQAGHVELLKSILKQQFVDSNLARKQRIDIEDTCVVELAAALGMTELLKSINRNKLFEVGKRFTNGRFALHVAACFGQTETVKYLATEFPEQIDICDSEGYTPFLLAVHYDQIGVIMYLLETYPQVAGNVTQRNAKNALLIACSNGNLELVMYLVSKGLSCFISDIHDRAPLNYAAYNGRLNVIEFLIEHYRNSKQSNKKEWILSRDDAGTEPMHDAAFQGHLTVLKHLLESAELDVRLADDDAKNTLLHYAVKKSGKVQGNRLEVVFYLMNRWPQMAVQKNGRGLTPVEVARLNEVDDDIIALMESRRLETHIFC